VARIRVGRTDVVLRYPAQASPVELWPDERFGGLIGASTPMRELFAQMSRVAQSDAPALILGETGTGKELAARAIHDASARASGPFVIVDCAALAGSLIEGELFGHARGAFTGAVASRAGSFEAANGGTIFLDEIGELPPELQPKLLRVLESRTVKRLGESEHRSIDVRLVAATHRDLRHMVNAGAFREDLYFRIAVLPLVLPPLRARQEDVPLLFNHFLAGRRTVEPVSERDLAEMPWLGNVRELRNFVERACAIGGARDALQSTAATAASAAVAAGQASPAPGAAASPIAFEQPFKEFRERWIDHGEREYLRRLLERCGRNVPLAAEQAGLDRTYVYRLIRKHGL
jgi:transcriptional regulator with GAF, ATPase, and Fis domain